MAIRPSGRAVNEARAVSIDRDFTKHAAGAVLIAFGDTKVICTASVEHQVPPFMRGKGRGWITAEYGMLPGATHTRTDREAARGKQGGRTVEIQRLIGRSLRAAVDLKALGERTVRIDCDVLQADGGHAHRVRSPAAALPWRTPSARSRPRRSSAWSASVSVGIYRGACVLDLDYAEDSNADTDMNVVMMDAKGFIEVQGTAERGAFQRAALDELLELAELGIGRLFEAQKTRARGMTESARDRAQAFVREMIARDVLTFGDFHVEVRPAQSPISSTSA